MERIWSRLSSRQADRGGGSTPRKVWVFGAGSAAGVALMYLLDPDRGRRRRAIARDRALAAARRSLRRAGGYGRWVGAETAGLVQRLSHAEAGEQPAASDAALADRVLSEAFRGSEVPAGRVNVNVEHGTVVLRGQLDRPEQIRELEAAVRKVDGVREVESYLHLPQTPAPNKQEAIEAR